MAPANPGADVLGDFGGVGPGDWARLASLCAEYCWRVDNYHSDRLPELFTEDAEWEAPGLRMAGGDQLRAGWAAHSKRVAGRLSRHMMANMRFTRDGETTASGVVGFTVFSGARGAVAPPVPVLVGEHHDRYERQPSGHWLFKARRVVPLFPSDWSLSVPGSSGGAD